MGDHPANPLVAATHPDPYPYYAALARERPLYRDDALGLWIASGARAVTAILADPLCRVRPPGEPVPKALVGSAAGEVFGRLARMADGAGHCPMKHAISGALASPDQRRARDVSRRWADALAPAFAARPDELTRFMFDMPVYVVATLLGFPEAALPRLALLVGSFARCLSPASSPGQVEAGKAAAAELLGLFRSRLADRAANGGDNLLARLARERAGPGDLDAVAANGIGLLSQTYEATAGLIGNTALAFARDPGLRQAVHDDGDALDGVVAEVSRCDPSVQNTRRWVAEAGTVAGRRMAAGDGILVVLAAANRDPAANFDPDRFDRSRQDRRCFTFGDGPHSCPGERLAGIVAAAGAGRVGLDLASVARPVSYCKSVNTRIPEL